MYLPVLGLHSRCHPAIARLDLGDHDARTMGCGPLSSCAARGNAYNGTKANGGSQTRLDGISVIPSRRIPLWRTNA